MEKAFGMQGGDETSLQNFGQEGTTCVFNIYWRILLRHGLQKWNARMFTVLIVFLSLTFFEYLSMDMQHET